MRFLPPLQSPRAVWRDLRAILARRSREQTIAALLSVGITSIIVVVFMLDPKVNTAPPPTVTYVQSWPATRTDEEIKAAQKVHQAEREAQAREKQERYREIANTFGIE